MTGTIGRRVYRTLRQVLGRVQDGPEDCYHDHEDLYRDHENLGSGAAASSGQPAPDGPTPRRAPGAHRHGRRSGPPGGPRRPVVATAVLLLATLAAVPALPALAQTADSFVIAYGDTVSDGVPEAGAGNLELGGATDSYHFDADAGDVAILDVLAGSSSTFRWRLDAPGGTTLFDTFYVDRSEELPDTGTYTLTVRGSTASTTGTYSFRLLLAPPPQQFTIAFGDTVSDGVPAPGAGNLEGPGAVDTYQFDATAGQVAVLDALTGSNTRIRWRLHAPDGSQIFDAAYQDRHDTLAQTGTYTLTVYGLTVTSFDTYSFQLLAAPPPQQFTIAFGDTVSDGVPAPGAGNLEGPGAIDAYQFDATAGQVAILDTLTGSNTRIRWRLHAPDGSQIFDAIYVDRQDTLTQTGTYTLTVYGLTATSFDTYSFQLLAAPPQIDEFTIAFGDTVSDGVPAPGAGNLEGPGAIDAYHFDATAGQVAILDTLTGDNTRIRWRLHAPDGSQIFDALYQDRQDTLPQTGTYTLTVYGLTATSFDTYSFQLREAPVNQPPVAVDDAAETEHGTPVTIDVLANDSDPDGDALLIDGVTQPADGTTAITGDQVTYTPRSGFAGTDSFSYSIADGRGSFAQATVTVTVHEPPNQPPTIAGIDDQTNTVGDTVDLAVQASDPDGDPLTYAATGLPPGLAIDAATGRIAGTIADGAETGSPYAVEVTATDPGPATATTGFQWTVDPAPGSGVVSVDIEIVPPVVVNDGHGVIPVVILGNGEVTGDEIDPATVTLEGMPVQRLFTWYLAFVCDVDQDGLDDLLVLIDDVAGAIPVGATTATLTGETFDGTAIEGTDQILLLPW